MSGSLAAKDLSAVAAAAIDAGRWADQNYTLSWT